MAKRKSKKPLCAGRFKKGGGRVTKREATCHKCDSQMAGSTKGGKYKQRKRPGCKPKRRRVAAKRKTHRTKGVMSHGHRVYGAAAKAVKRKRARKGHAPKRHRRVHGVAGMSIGHAPHHHHAAKVLIVKADTGAVIGSGYGVKEAVEHAKKKRARRSSSARAGSLGRF